MDKIWGMKKRMTTQNRQKSNAKRFFLNCYCWSLLLLVIVIVGHCYCWSLLLLVIVIVGHCYYSLQILS